MKINMIAVLVLVGFAFGGQALVGYNYGSGNQKRFHEIVAFAYKFEAAIALCISISLYIFAPFLVKAFFDDMALISLGTLLVSLLLLGMIFVAVVLISTCIFQATGKAVEAFILSASRQGFLFAIVLFLASKTAGYYGILASQAISDCLTAVIAVILFRRLFHSLRAEKTIE
ncbi:MAG: MATE family efflux transporter [Eubacteriales bacterium]|nr:MATE family efflux transporter [Eubacteriales bacterium]